jgi:hypothetical protein
MTQNGATLDYQGGQPVMDQGLENEAQIRLFTREGWCGNVFLRPENQIGSPFEAAISGQAITLSGLEKIRNLADIALDGPAFPDRKIIVENPTSDITLLTADLGPGKAPLLFQRNGTNWAAQAQNPASARLN